MGQSSQSSTDRDGDPEILWRSGERILSRRWWTRADGTRCVVLAVSPAAKHPSPAILERLAHEYALKDVLDSAWAAQPLAMTQDRGRTVLVLADPGGQPLVRLLGAAMEVGGFLRVAIGIAASLGQAHRRGLVHKDLKPANILVNRAEGLAWLTGFGIASRLRRERQSAEPSGVIAGTLAYMAPEQTGRMNRSIDSRSDLYALGVTLYQMLTGVLPFTATDPMEWIHCHIARKPLPPRERMETVPEAVSAIIMKLLAKPAEERYQTAAGVERDLRRCLEEWDSRGCIDDFAPGEDDTPDRLLIPEKLYGRAPEVATLLAAFDQMVETGVPALVLVSGYSGIGKSSIVHELHKALVPARGLFAAGKFDQHKRDIPYATLAQAFEGLVRSLLGKDDAELNLWRAAILAALGPNGRLMIDLVPELRLIIGEQPEVPELPPRDAQLRFRLVFRGFIAVFARKQHPLALFLDDLQWLDAATLDLLEDLVTGADLQHLLLIGAYRDNEVGAEHALTRKLQAIKQAGGTLSAITLAPLGQEHIRQLVEDALRCAPTEAAPLAHLVFGKTGGNPFFTIQFLSALAEEGLLYFDHDTAKWRWDKERIHAKGYTDNVVELMIGRLSRLPADTREALQCLACLGNVAEVSIVSIVLGVASDRVQAVLWPALLQELVECVGGFYRFGHDRVQEAAYSLIPAERRDEAHLRIGRLLVAHIPPGRREEAIFALVNQWNCGAALITAPEERELAAELNLVAGKRAKAATAYASALTYLAAGAALVAGPSWQRRHALVFDLELQRAECEFLSGDLVAAETHLAVLSYRAATTVERAAVACLRMDVYTTLDQSGRALSVGLDYLRHLGIDWSPHPTDEEARLEYERIWSQLGEQAIEDLIDLPRMGDPASLATLDVLIKLWPAALFTDMNLFSLAMCRAVNLSLKHGNSDGSCAAYVRLGTIAGALFGDYQAGLSFGRLGLELAEQGGMERFQARTHMIFGCMVLPWASHVRSGRDWLRRAFEGACKIGDLTYAAYSCAHLGSNMLAAGENLASLQSEAEHGLAFAQKMRFGLVTDVIATQLALVRTLRGLTPVFGSFADAQFDEAQLVRRWSGNPNLAYSACWYLIRKLQACVLAGDVAAAVDASLQARPLLWTSLSTLEMADYHFYSALARAAAAGHLVASEQRNGHLEALAAHHRQMQIWAEHCPENFADRVALAGAEIACLDGRALEAMGLYEQAIRLARAHGFIHSEAIANERAAAFHAARGLDTITDAYLRSARRCYRIWGADGKVRQLDLLHPQLGEAEPEPAPTSTIGAPVDHLDLATVLKVSQAVSGEIMLDKLLDTLLRTAIEQAGAERGVLIVTQGSERRVAAEAMTEGDTVVVRLCDLPVTAASLPETIIQTVLRTGETVILGDAAIEDAFAADFYIRRRHARSILCLPLLNQSKLIGLLYLENNLAGGVFTPARISVLRLVASQAAIALENTRLYRDLAEREAKIRRLVDANIIGIMIWSLDGQVLEANDAFLHIVGYERSDLLTGRLRWSELTPPEWRDQHDRWWIPEMKMTGSVRPYEQEYFRKDGSRVPVLVGATSLNDMRNQGVAFVLDLTERKRSEQALRQAQAELAHLTRLTTMGELTASIAHEINQPLATVATHASAGLRWLSHQPPNLDEARACLQQTIRESHRAGNVITRIRALVKKSTPIKVRLDLHEVIQEVVAIIGSEAARHTVLVRTELAAGLPPVHGDRVQVQQVVLNLAVNGIDALKAVSGRPRELWIRSQPHQPGWVLISVQDTGIGLDSKAFERVFEAFYTTKAEGMGMGLSISRSIIEAHGGQLWPSANDPHGATFQFTLPTDGAAERDAAASPLA
jgi:PAS domain S-box-containing protein